MYLLDEQSLAGNALSEALATSTREYHPGEVYFDGIKSIPCLFVGLDAQKIRSRDEHNIL